MMVASASSPLEQCPAVFRHGGCTGPSYSSPTLTQQAQAQQHSSPKSSPDSVLDHKRFVVAALLSGDRVKSPPPPSTSHVNVFSSNASSFAKPPLRRCKSLPNLHRNRSSSSVSFGNNNASTLMGASFKSSHNNNMNHNGLKKSKPHHKRVTTRAGGEDRGDSLPLFWFRPSPEAPSTGRKSFRNSATSSTTSPTSLRKRKTANHVRHQSLKFPLPSEKRPPLKQQQQQQSHSSLSRHTRHQSLMSTTTSALMAMNSLPPSGRPLSPTFSRPLSPLSLSPKPRSSSPSKTTSQSPPPPPPPPPLPVDILSQVRLKSSELQGLSFVEEDEE